MAKQSSSFSPTAGTPAASSTSQSAVLHTFQWNSSLDAQSTIICLSLEYTTRWSRLSQSLVLTLQTWKKSRTQLSETAVLADLLPASLTVPLPLHFLLTATEYATSTDFSSSLSLTGSSARISTTGQDTATRGQYAAMRTLFSLSTTVRPLRLYLMICLYSVSAPKMWELSDYGRLSLSRSSTLISSTNRTTLKLLRKRYSLRISPVCSIRMMIQMTARSSALNSSISSAALLSLI